MRALSTGWARLIRCQTDGRRRHCGVLVEPVPRRISTARRASRRTVLTVVTVRGEQRPRMRWWRWSPHNACHWRDQRGRPAPRRRAGAAWAAALVGEYGLPAVVSVHAANSGASLGGWSTWASSSGMHRRPRSIGVGCRAVVFELPASVVGQLGLSRNSASSGPAFRACATVVPVHGDKSFREVQTPESRANSTRKLQIQALGCRRGLRGLKAVVSAPAIQMCCGGLVKRAFLQGHSRRSVTRRWRGWLAGDLLRGRGWL
jgi:hypothetical protein